VGLDPKETFALITWIVYLIVLCHVENRNRQQSLLYAILASLIFILLLT